MGWMGRGVRGWGRVRLSYSIVKPVFALYCEGERLLAIIVCVKHIDVLVLLAACCLCLCPSFPSIKYQTVRVLFLRCCFMPVFISLSLPTPLPPPLPPPPPPPPRLLPS